MWYSIISATLIHEKHPVLHIVWSDAVDETLSLGGKAFIRDGWISTFPTSTFVDWRMCEKMENMYLLRTSGEHVHVTNPHVSGDLWKQNQQSVSNRI